MYVLEFLNEIARRFSIGERPREYMAGLQEGRRDRTTHQDIGTAPNLDTVNGTSEAPHLSSDDEG